MTEGSSTLARVLQVDAGYLYTCVLLQTATEGIEDGGVVKCFGRNNYGQLGQGSSVTSIGRGEFEMGQNLTAVNVGTGRYVKQIACGYYHVCALLDNQKVKCWGRGRYNGKSQTYGYSETDMGDNLPYLDLGEGVLVKSISATCAVTTTDSLICWGPISGTSGSQFNLDNGSLATFSFPDKVKQVRDVQYQELDTVRCVLLENGDVYCFGKNKDSGTLGAGDKEDYATTPVKIKLNGAVESLGSFKFYTICGMFNSTGRMKCWGINNWGKCGYPDKISDGVIGDSPADMGENLPFVETDTEYKIQDVATGFYTGAVIYNYEVRTWGFDSYGQLGGGTEIYYGDSPSETIAAATKVNLGSDFLAERLVVSERHTCILSTNATVKCFGNNEFGALGNGGAFSVVDVGPAVTIETLPSSSPTTMPTYGAPNTTTAPSESPSAPQLRKGGNLLDNHIILVLGIALGTVLGIMFGGLFCYRRYSRRAKRQKYPYSKNELAMSCYEIRSRMDTSSTGISSFSDYSEDGEPQDYVVQPVSEKNLSIFLHAAGKGKLDGLRLGREQYNIPVDATDPLDGTTALMKIISHGQNMKALEYLLAQGADVNAVNDKGETPLMLAMKLKEDNFALRLLTIPEDDIFLEAVDKKGLNALDIGKANGKNIANSKAYEVLLIKTSPVTLFLREHRLERLASLFAHAGITDIRSLKEIALQPESVRTYRKLNLHLDENERGRIRVAFLQDDQRPNGSIVMKNRSYQWHVFLSHDWGVDVHNRDNHKRVKRINQGLQMRGLRTWFDDSEIHGDIVTAMREGIQGSAIVLIFITKNYLRKVGSKKQDNCEREYAFAQRTHGKHQMIPVVMEKQVKDQDSWKNTNIFFELGGETYIDCSQDTNLEVSLDRLHHEILHKLHRSLK